MSRTWQHTLTRRSLLRGTALGALGLSLPKLLHLEAQARASGPSGRPRSLIFLFLYGGPSQIDIWDMKPDASEEYRGLFRPIRTTVPGTMICEHLPRMARLARHYSVLRSLHHTCRNHQPAGCWLFTGVNPGSDNSGQLRPRPDDPPALVRAAQPTYAVGSFRDNGVIPGGVAIRDGQAATFTNDKPHGRTLAGVSKDGRVLTLLIADCYNSGVSEGLSLADAARVLQAAGAHEGIFLDGGGSATLVGRSDASEPLLLNRPAGVLNIPGTLRPIAASIGFTGLRRSAEPIPAVHDWEASWYVVLWARSIIWVRLNPVRAAMLLAILVLSLAVLVRLWRRRRRRLARVAATSPKP